MPNYDYKCEKCAHLFEVFQSMNDPKLTDCPQEGCDGPVKRLLGTGAGIIFKGSGFYQTDYRSESYKAGEKKASESSAPKKEKKETKPSKSSE
ncbi:MAG: putative FmdB family regulatory protein [Akkermansiaceae bacterium]|jgi:putative FmdB family regulatory protein|tara:strand:+ start:2205 stop:2483 length:279 start_codon:yes stop_codon:yes gene_type:complete